MLGKVGEGFVLEATQAGSVTGELRMNFFGLQTRMGSIRFFLGISGRQVSAEIIRT